jgi:hypothetical protein
MTIQIGNIAPKMAPKPLLIYLTPQVLKPLLNTKFNKLKIRIVFHCLALGQGVFWNKKKATYKRPPKNCRMATSCIAGMCLTPSFEASQVVPQKKLTQHKASMGIPIASILEKNACLILAFNYNWLWIKL